MHPLSSLFAAPDTRADEVTLESVQAEYKTGKSFVYDQLDVFNRPVMIITASKHNVGEHWQTQATNNCSILRPLWKLQLLSRGHLLQTLAAMAASGSTAPCTRLLQGQALCEPPA